LIEYFFVREIEMASSKGHTNGRLEQIMTALAERVDSIDKRVEKESQVREELEEAQRDLVRAQGISSRLTRLSRKLRQH
jgi:hypothetical protein